MEVELTVGVFEGSIEYVLLVGLEIDEAYLPINIRVHLRNNNHIITTPF